MGSPRDNAVHLLTNLGTAPAGVLDRLSAASALTDEEIATVRLALPGTEGVSALASRMLDEWEALTPGERIAGLLVLVEQLANHEGERG